MFIITRTDNNDFLKLLHTIFSKDSILKKEGIKNTHLTVNEYYYYKFIKEDKEKLIKEVLTLLDVKQIDIIPSTEYKPGISFVNAEGEEILSSGHKVFAVDNIIRFNILKLHKMLSSEKGIIITGEKFKEVLKEADDIKKVALDYEKRKKEAELKYQEELKIYESIKEKYKKDLENYKKEKEKITQFNKEERIKAKKENRKPELRKLYLQKPIPPTLTKPKKENVKLPRTLDSLHLKDKLQTILTTYLLKPIHVEMNNKDIYVLIPSGKEIEGSVFKRENLLNLNTSPKKVNSIDFIQMLKNKLKEEDEELKEEKKFFYSSFKYAGGGSYSRFTKIDALNALLELQEIEKWENLQNFSKPPKEKELPVLTKLKPNQTASMLAGGIGNFAKEININGEKLLVKGATIKEKKTKQTNVNNVVIEEIVEEYIQEIGILNISRRELQIIR